MPETILQKFLDLQFLKTDDEDHIERLKEAAAEVTSHLRGNKNELISYTLAAIDPQIGESDLAILKTEEMIIAKWSTFKNSITKTQEKPTTYIRAVMLEALSTLIDDVKSAGLIWYCARNVVRYYSLGREKDLIYDFLGAFGGRVESESHGLWGVGGEVEVPELKIGKLSVPRNSSAKVDEGVLVNHLKAAAIHKDYAEKAGAGENKFNIGDRYNNHDWQWANFLAERAGKGVSEELNKSFSQQNEQIKIVFKAVDLGMQKISKEVTPFFQELVSRLIANQTASEKRNQLLWWKESLYSQVLERGYRDLSDADLVFSLAIDGTDLVSPLYPESVNYFLKEIMKSILGDKSEEVTNLTTVKEKLASLAPALSQRLSALESGWSGRKMMVSSILDSKTGFPDGIKEDIQLSSVELLLWLFHDLQALQLLKTQTKQQ